MPVKPPTPDQLREIALDLGMSMSDDDVESYRTLMLPNFDAYNVVDAMPDHVPCAMRDGRPVGLMLAGGYHEEATIYRAAHALEQAGDWRTA